MKKTTKPPPRELPPSVTEADLTHDYSNAIPYSEVTAIFGSATPYLTFYRLKDGWVLTTLHISNASGRQRARGVEAARSYAIGLKDSKIYTVGRGPHVLDTVEVYVSKINLDRLKVYVDLFNKGLADASTIRDRISSRRAQGQLRRSGFGIDWNS